MKGLNRREFSAWLRDNENEEVGLPGSTELCPISTYLKNKLDVVDVFTDYYEVTIVDSNGREKEKSIPEWAQNFIILVDDTGNNPITGDKAHSILKGI